ncbi:MAG: hybrid sensor histidine kinase/response regulator, partial [Bacteroidetes bacterium]
MIGMQEFLRNIDTDQYYRMLTSIPDTCIVFFSPGLEVIRIINQDLSLEELIPGQGLPVNLEDTGDRRWKNTIEPLCRNALQGIPGSRILEMDSGQVRITADRITNKAGEIMGMLVLQGNSGYQKKYRDQMENVEENSEIKSRFMARLSHEIRTPLNAVIGFIEQLQKTDLDRKQRNYLNIIDKSSIYLLDLVDEILTYTKMEAGELTLDEVDF